MSSTPKITILNAEDNDASRCARSRILRKAGFKVIEAATGTEALRLVLEKTPQLVLLDVHLRDISGLEVCQRIKSDPATSSVSVLQLSASSVEAGDKARGVENGADSYLTEPVEPEVLIATVRALLRMRQAEEAVRDSARQWQTTFDAISDGVCLLDVGGKVLRCNKAFAHMLGKPSSEITGRTCQECVYATLSHIEESSFLRVLKTHRREGVELPMGDRWVRVTVDPVLNEHGAFTGAVCILSDITERKRAEEAIRERDERFRIMADTAPVMLWMSGPDTLCTFFNKPWLDFTGRTLRQEMGSGWMEGVHPDDLQRCSDTYLRAFKKRQNYRVEYRLRRGDGKYRWVLATGIPRLTPGGVFAGYVGSCIDITERKRTEEERARLLAREQEARKEAEAANRAKDVFLATVSHELRTPLTAILGWARLIRAGHLDETTYARAIAALERNAKSQAQLIEDLLDISRIITGKLHLDVRPVELGPIIKAAIDSVRPAANTKALRLESVLDSEAGLVSGDPDRLQQVVWNLLSNAVKFTPEGGRVEVRLERVGSHVQIKVSDTGVGIRPDFLPYLFERFRQADSTTTRSHGGLGLGLAIVRHLVELHGGTVHAESRGEGQGATFMVILPLAPLRIADCGLRNEKAANEKSAIRNLQSEILEGLRLLVVDDEADARELLTTVLEQSGARVMAVSSAAEALEVLKRSRLDVLVSDIEMPGEDGYALIRKVRTLEVEQGGWIPSVALTAYARVEDRLRVLSAGYQMHVPKPIEPTELVTVIANLVGRAEKD